MKFQSKFIHFPYNWPLWGEFTGHRWIPLTKASDADLRCFRWSAPWINGSVNKGDLGCHRAHYDVIAMPIQSRFTAPQRVALLSNLWNVLSISERNCENKNFTLVLRGIVGLWVHTLRPFPVWLKNKDADYTAIPLVSCWIKINKKLLP